MRIAIDIMGGDHAPQELLTATVQSAKMHPENEYIMVGSAAALDSISDLPQNISKVYSNSVMAMDESVENLMKKRDSSIWMATELVKKQQADAVVSAGSTAAQMAAATLLLGRIKGISRPAIGTVIPTLRGGKFLLDMGANADCSADMLLQFARMGAVYVEQLLQLEKPQVALLSNGTEAHKGSKMIQETHALLQESELNFIGNLEGRDILYGAYDVLVCDGMSGNIAIKSLEGTLSVVMTILKRELTKNFKRTIGAALIKDGLKEVKKVFDYEEYGGAPLLGVKGVSIVCHGSSKAKAIVSALDAAAICVQQGLVSKLTLALQAAPESVE